MNRSITFLKKIDAVFGPALLSLAASRRSKPGFSTDGEKKLNRILIIRPGGIGDAALLLPSLKALKRVSPETQVDVLCEPRNKGIFVSSPFVNRIYNYRDVRDLFRVQKNYYEMVVDTEQSHFLSTILASKFRRSFKVGFATKGRETVYDNGVEYSHEQYEMDSFSRLFKDAIEEWSSHYSWDPPYLYPLPKEKAKVSGLLRETERPIVCLFPGASIVQRRWPAERWTGVAEHLWKEGLQPVLLGAASEQEMIRGITRQADCHLINLCGKLSLSETGALFERSRLLVSMDSGILHLGVVAGLPTVSLFGPGIAEKWGPRGKMHVVLNKELPCSPCTRFGDTPPCPIGARCMKAITVNDVVTATSKLLSRC